MPDTPMVTAQIILRAERDFRRRGLQRILLELEKSEPDLAEYAFESLTELHQQLLNLGGPAKHTQRLFNHMQTVVMVCIQAMRQAYDGGLNTPAPSSPPPAGPTKSAEHSDPHQDEDDITGPAGPATS